MRQIFTVQHPWPDFPSPMGKKTRIRQDGTILFVVSVAEDQGSNIQQLLFLSWPLACANLMLVPIYFNLGHNSLWIRTPDSDLISGL